MNNRNILFIIHRLYFQGIPKKGGIDHILNFLKKNNYVTTIEHPFEKINHPSVFNSKNKKVSRMSFLKPPLLWIEEVMINTLWVVKKGEKFDLAIASDPLNFLSCKILKILGKVEKIQFHSTDYSTVRFENKLLNKVYQFLYKFSIRNADIITVVSKRMFDHAIFYSSLNHKKIILLPNSPSYKSVPRVPINKRKRNLVLTVGIFKNQIDMENLVACLKLLKREDTNIKLEIIGNVEKEFRDVFINNGLKDNVIFHGITDYKKALKIVSESYIGITSYKKTSTYMHYADSLKIREYAAAGIPSVCDNVYATSEEVQEIKAGYVYKNPQEMAKYIQLLFKDLGNYKKTSQNSLNWAKKMDKDVLLSAIYSSLFSHNDKNRGS